MIVRIVELEAEVEGLRKDLEAADMKISSLQGVIDAVDRVLRKLGWIHASRAIAIENGAKRLQQSINLPFMADVDG